MRRFYSIAQVSELGPRFGVAGIVSGAGNGATVGTAIGTRSLALVRGLLPGVQEKTTSVPALGDQHRRYRCCYNESMCEAAFRCG